MEHDLKHEFRQNEALRLLARYLRELRAVTRSHYPMSPGDVCAEVDQILGPDEAESAPLEAVLNREVPTPEQAKALSDAVAKKESSPSLKKA